MKYQKHKAYISLALSIGICYRTKEFWGKKKERFPMLEEKLQTHKQIKARKF